MSDTPDDPVRHEIDTCEGIAAPASAIKGEGQRADINLGHACNNRCVFCMQGHSSKDQRRWLSLERLKKELDHYADEIGLKSLGLLGGEPTLYPHLFEGLDYARAKGFDDITINTNGYRLAKAEFCDEAVRHGINRYCLSVHSHLEDIEDELSGRKGSMNTKKDAIDNLLSLQREGKGVRSISINAVLTSLNLPTLPEFVEYWAGKGIRDIRFNFVRPEGRAADHKELVPRFTQAMPLLLKAVALNERKWKINLSFGEIPYCIYPQRFFANRVFRGRYIGEYRDRRTHVSSFNNPGNDGLSDEDGRQRFVWQDLKVDVLKQLTPACRRCRWIDVCGGVWKNYIALYGDEEFSPLDVD